MQEAQDLSDTYDSKPHASTDTGLPNLANELQDSAVAALGQRVLDEALRRANDEPIVTRGYTRRFGMEMLS